MTLEVLKCALNFAINILKEGCFLSTCAVRGALLGNVKNSPSRFYPNLNAYSRNRDSRNFCSMLKCAFQETSFIGKKKLMWFGFFWLYTPAIPVHGKAQFKGYVSIIKSISLPFPSHKNRHISNFFLKTLKIQTSKPLFPTTETYCSFKVE